MKRKFIWMLFSIIILVKMSNFLIGCGEEIVEYRLDADIIYKNETNHHIKYFEFYPDYDKKVLIFELQPNSEKKFELRGDGNRKVDIETSQLVFYNILNRSYKIWVSYDNDDKCIIYRHGESFTEEANYNIKKISTRYYELVYTFTEAEYNKAVDCELVK